MGRSVWGFESHYLAISLCIYTSFALYHLSLFDRDAIGLGLRLRAGDAWYRGLPAVSTDEQPTAGLMRSGQGQSDGRSWPVEIVALRYMTAADARYGERRRFGG